MIVCNYWYNNILSTTTKIK